MPDYWVYKINEQKHKHGVFWSIYFEDSSVRELAGEQWRGYLDSAIDFRSVAPGDFIFAYQVDTRSIVGIVEVLEVRKNDQEVEAFLV
jgi:predicted RNA-binding protein with PUA-like domain